MFHLPHQGDYLLSFYEVYMNCLNFSYSLVRSCITYIISLSGQGFEFAFTLITSRECSGFHQRTLFSDVYRDLSLKSPFSLLLLLKETTVFVYIFVYSRIIKIKIKIYNNI